MLFALILQVRPVKRKPSGFSTHNFSWSRRGPPLLGLLLLLLANSKGQAILKIAHSP
jgi:hypothetical protein